MSNLKVQDYMTTDVSVEEVDITLDKVMDVFKEGKIGQTNTLPKTLCNWIQLLSEVHRH